MEVTFSKLLAFVRDTSKAKYVLNLLCDTEFKPINFKTNCDIASSLKTTKHGKACGDFICTDRLMLPILSVLLNYFLSHVFTSCLYEVCYICPIIKNKTGDNYKSIALVTAMSTILEICILNVLEPFLITSSDLRSSTLRNYVYLHPNNH